MKKIENIGNLPSFLRMFLTHKLFLESKETEVYDCSYNEIVNKAQEEKLEPQVMIDKPNGRAYLCAVGASYNRSEDGTTTLPPIFYFSELDEDRKRMFQRELDKARQMSMDKVKQAREQEAAVKKATREAGDNLRDE